MPYLFSSLEASYRRGKYNTKRNVGNAVPTASVNFRVAFSRDVQWVEQALDLPRLSTHS